MRSTASGAHGIIVNLRACNLQQCYGCDPWVGFCFYCKQILRDGIPCSSCHHGVSLSHIQELNNATKDSSEDEDQEDEDEDEDEDKDEDEDEEARPAKRTRRHAREGLLSKGNNTASAIEIVD